MRPALVAGDNGDCNFEVLDAWNVNHVLEAHVSFVGEKRALCENRCDRLDGID